MITESDYKKNTRKLNSIRKVKSHLAEVSKSFSLPICILTTGSVEYGFNKKEAGNLDDVDCILIIEPTLNYGEFIKYLNCLIMVEVKPTISQFHLLKNGKVGILRVSGRAKSVEVSFHTMTLATFKNLVTKIDFEIKTLLPYKEKYIKAEFSESILGFPIFISADKSYEWYDKSRSLILLYEYGFHNIDLVECKNKSIELKNWAGKKIEIHKSLEQVKDRYNIDGKGKYILKGTVGDKLLKAEVCYSALNFDIEMHLKLFWMKFIKLSYRQNPSATELDILHSFSRSTRYSVKYERKTKSNILFFKNIFYEC